MKRIVLTLLIVLGLGASMAATYSSTALATAKDEICNGANAAGGTTGCGGGDTGITALVASIVTVFSWIVGVLAVIMIIFAGFQYVSSGGDSGKISSAKNTLIYALVGIVVVALSQIIVKFVLQKVVG
jgi:hypothetical protein